MILFNKMLICFRKCTIILQGNGCESQFRGDEWSWLLGRWGEPDLWHDNTLTMSGVVARFLSVMTASLSIHQVDCHMRITITMCGVIRGLHVAFIAMGCRCCRCSAHQMNCMEVSWPNVCLKGLSTDAHLIDWCVLKNENTNPFAWLNRQDSLMGFSWEKIGTFQVYPPKPPITSS